MTPGTPATLQAVCNSESTCTVFETNVTASACVMPLIAAADVWLMLPHWLTQPAIGVPAADASMWLTTEAATPLSPVSVSSWLHTLAVGVWVEAGGLDADGCELPQPASTAHAPSVDAATARILRLIGVMSQQLPRPTDWAPYSACA
jgi:hypothetical protein